MPSSKSPSPRKSPVKPTRPLPPKVVASLTKAQHADLKNATGIRDNAKVAVKEKTIEHKNAKLAAGKSQKLHKDSKKDYEISKGKLENAKLDMDAKLADVQTHQAKVSLAHTHLLGAKRGLYDAIEKEGKMIKTLRNQAKSPKKEAKKAASPKSTKPKTRKPPRTRKNPNREGLNRQHSPDRTAMRKKAQVKEEPEDETEDEPEDM